MPLAAAAAPTATAATTTPTPTPAIIAVARLSAAVITKLRFGTELGGAMIRVRLRWFVVVDFFIAAAGNITGLAWQ